MSEYRVPKRAVLAAIGATLHARASAEQKIVTRLMLLTRMGFPNGVNTGRGFRGGYTLDQLWQVVLAFRVLNFAIPLSRTIAIVNESWDLAYSAIANSIPGLGIPDLTFHWLIEPAGFADFDLEPRPQGDEGMRPIETIALSKGEAIQDVALRRRLTDYGVINASAVVEDVLQALANPALEIHQDELRAMLQDWANRPTDRLRSLLGRGE